MTRAKKEKITVKGSAGHERYATPEIIANYRAKRLACKKIVEIGASIGGQTSAFAKSCDEVITVEIDPEKAKQAPKYKNVKSIVGDGLSFEVAKQCEGAEVVFCDTERPESEEERRLSTISPNPKEIVRLYSKITDKIAIELPPHLPESEIPFDCEKEYLSVRGELNRLTVYLGGLKRCKYSVVAFPSGARLESDKKVAPKKSELKRYIFEADRAVVKAGLVGMLDLPVWREEKNRLYLTSETKEKSDFLKTGFQILSVCKENDAHSELVRLRAGSVVLKAKVDPSEYWKVRRRYEHGLSGKRQLYLILLDDDAVICEKLD